MVRAYFATTPKVISELITNKEAKFEEYLTPDQFEFGDSVDDEEREHLISQLAAEDSLELNEGKFGFVLAADLKDSQLNEAQLTLNLNQVAALLFSEDGEELSWYAPSEIAEQIEPYARA